MTFSRAMKVLPTVIKSWLHLHSQTRVLRERTGFGPNFQRKLLYFLYLFVYVAQIIWLNSKHCFISFLYFLIRSPLISKSRSYDLVGYFFILGMLVLLIYMGKVWVFSVPDKITPQIIPHRNILLLDNRGSLQLETWPTTTRHPISISTHIEN